MADTLEKVNKELEVDRFIRTMKHVQIMLKALFTKTERFLIANNRRFLVSHRSMRQVRTDLSAGHR